MTPASDFPSRPSIAVIGTGAVGGYYGARLAQHGHAVHFLFRSDYAAVRERGLTVTSPDGNFAIPSNELHAYDDVRNMPQVDLVLIALKTTANDQYEPLVRPLLHERTAILTLQNGLGNEDRLAELFGAERVLGGLAFVCINRVGPGQIAHLDYGLVRIGEFGRPRGPRVESIARLFQSSQIRCDVLDDLRYGRWEKLVWNVPFNGLGAALDLATDALLATEDGRTLVAQLMGEVVATAQRVGANLPESVIAQQIERTPSMGPYRTSMQIDRRQGRPLEVEAILGEPQRVAARAGVPTPHLSELLRLVRLVNTGKQFNGQ